MKEEITLWVCRRQTGKESDLELHNMRKNALHNSLENIDGLDIQDWGKTDDTQPHEWVEIIIFGWEIISPVVVPALELFGKELLKAGVSIIAVKTIKKVIQNVSKHQEKEEMKDCNFHLKDGKWIQFIPDEKGIRIRVSWTNITFTMTYDLSKLITNKG